MSHKALSPSLKPVKSEYRSKWRQFSSPLTLRGKKEEEDNFWFAGKLLLLGPWTSHVLPVLDTKCSNTNSLNRKKKKDYLTKENWLTYIYCLTDNQIGVRFMWKYFMKKKNKIHFLKIGPFMLLWTGFSRNRIIQHSFWTVCVSDRISFLNA